MHLSPFTGHFIKPIFALHRSSHKAPSKNKLAQQSNTHRANLAHLGDLLAELPEVDAELQRPILDPANKADTRPHE